MVKRLRLPRRLGRQLSATNSIENLIGSTRRISARVKPWRNGRMIPRWTTAAIAGAAQRFRRVSGAHEGMPQLVRAHHESSLATVARRRPAACHLAASAW